MSITRLPEWIAQTRPEKNGVPQAGVTCSKWLEIHVLLEVHSSGLATIGVLRPILGRIVPCQGVSICKGLIMWV